MNAVYITANAICSECGAFLQPELVRDAADKPTGEPKVRRHRTNCSLHGTVGIVKLNKLEICELAPDVPEKAA